MELASQLRRRLAVPGMSDVPSLAELRHAITCEAVTLVQHTLAARKKRREPIPFPLSFVAQKNLFEAPLLFETNLMHDSSVKNTTRAAEPSANCAKPEAPASAPLNIPHSGRNWAVLLDQHRPAGRTVAPLTTIASRAPRKPATQSPAIPAAASKIAGKQPTPPSKTWEQVQTRVFAEMPLPTGIHDGYVLSRLVESQRIVSGLVVSIGISKSSIEASGTASRESISASVRTLIRSLLGPQDFASASAHDEYILIFPQDRGAAAQRRLSEIAQKLWDFQLRMLGQAAILFSWGGVEVRGESIDEAVAAASDRMQETRRNRSPKALEKHGLRIAG